MPSLKPVGHLTWISNVRRAVQGSTDASLPVDEANRLLHASLSNGSISIFGHDVATEQEGSGHVLSGARIDLKELFNNVYQQCSCIIG